jgi:hypothetical protein
MNPQIVPIVEGQTEVHAFPILLRRILHEYLQEYSIDVASPYRALKSRMVKDGLLERYIEQAIRARDNASSVIVLLDADEDLPCVLGPELLKRAITATNLPVSVVVANKEYEAWFLGSKESLRGTCGIADTATAPQNPEAIQDAKARLKANMTNNRVYSEVSDSPAFTAKMDLEMARRNCPSFDKLIREVEQLVGKMHT